MNEAREKLDEYLYLGQIVSAKPSNNTKILF